jgi:hypothetical protein
VVKFVREAHKRRALKFDKVRPVGMGQVFDERADIGAGVRIRWAETIIIGIAERIARDGARMKHA